MKFRNTKKDAAIVPRAYWVLYNEKSNDDSETLILYDLLSKEITKIMSKEKTTILPLNQLQKGIYILKAEHKVFRVEKL